MPVFMCGHLLPNSYFVVIIRRKCVVNSFSPYIVSITPGFHGELDIYREEKGAERMTK